MLGSPSLNLDTDATARHTVGTVSNVHLSIDHESSMAPFEQLRTQIARAVAEGRLPAGGKLPTVRRLAADLGLAPNTVARAYRELEADSVIATRGRHGTFVHSDILDQQPNQTSVSQEPDAHASTAHASAAHEAKAAAADYVRSVRRLGLSSPEAVRLVENAWDKGNLTAGDLTAGR